MKNNVKVISLIALLIVSVYSGLSFNFPKEWGWNFVVNVGAMARTFLYMSIGITLLRVPKFIEQIRG